MFDVKLRILNFLLKEECSYNIKDGIVIVETPDKEIWDFTVPMVKPSQTICGHKGCTKKPGHRPCHAIDYDVY